MSIIQGNAHTSAGGGYQIERSLRFNSADSAYLNRTFGSNGNQKAWTLSFWVKRSKLGDFFDLFGVNAASPDQKNFRFNSDDTLTFYVQTSAATVVYLQTSQVFRDVSAWYHVVLVIDTANATSTDRIRLYANGSRITAFSSTTYPSLNLNIPSYNTAIAHYLGSFGPGTSLFNGYMTEVNFIDGQALTPSSFGETDSATGVWKPKAFSGTYGTNGFYLKFADNSGTTSTTLGKDSSGNGNNWTPNNFSVTAGAGNDSLVDSPTNYGTDTGVGGEARGNYATLNPLAKSSVGTLDNGNLQWTSGNSGGGTAGNGTRASIGMNVGKWYTEVTRLDTVFWSYPGISNESHLTSIYNGGDANSWSIDASGQKVTNNSSSAYGSATWAANDIINIAYDADNGELYFGKNGTWLNSGNPVTRTNPAFTSLSGTLFFTVGFSANTASASSVVFNFGQRPFAYTAPSGFKALCTQNLPTPTIGATSTTQANDYFNAVTYSGSSAEQNITGVGFQPDFVWIKSRSNAESHVLSDAVRGATGGSYYRLFSDATAAESANVDNSVLALNADGFRVSGGTAATNVGRSGYTYVSWNWKANGAGSSNTAGTITSTVSANTTSGFSIVTYTGNGNNNATVGHGLGVAPGFIIIKDRDVNSNANNWFVWHKNLSADNNVQLNGTGAQYALSATYGGPTESASPSTTFKLYGGLGSTNVNESGDAFVAYCFAPVAGYSAFGSYTGNGSTSNDGPFIYTGFRPRFIMGKRSDSTGGWWMFDTARSEFNLVDDYFYAHLSDAEFTNVTTLNLDVLSNGFKVRSGSAPSTWINASGGTYIYMAFAEFPFKYSLAR